MIQNVRNNTNTYNNCKDPKEFMSLLFVTVFVVLVVVYLVLWFFRFVFSVVSSSSSSSTTTTNTTNLRQQRLQHQHRRRRSMSLDDSFSSLRLRTRSIDSLNNSVNRSFLNMAKSHYSYFHSHDNGTSTQHKGSAGSRSGSHDFFYKQQQKQQNQNQQSQRFPFFFFLFRRRGRGGGSINTISNETGSKECTTNSTDLYREMAMMEDTEFMNEIRDFYLDQQQHQQQQNSLPSSSSSSNNSRIRYYGPTVNCLKYITLTPPPSWEIARKSSLLTDTTKFNLHRKLSFTLTSSSTSSQLVTYQTSTSTTSSSASIVPSRSVAAAAPITTTKKSGKSNKGISSSSIGTSSVMDSPIFTTPSSTTAATSMTNTLQQRHQPPSLSKFIATLTIEKITKQTLDSSNSNRKKKGKLKGGNNIPSNSNTKILQFPVDSISIHTKQPTAGGVMDIYRINLNNNNNNNVVNNKVNNEKTIGGSEVDSVDNNYNHHHTTTNHTDVENWKMEHTFRSAQSAAQFQIDLLGLQLLWPTIYNMYQAFALIHKGSLAYRGSELVVHYQPLPTTSSERRNVQQESNTNKGGDEGTVKSNNKDDDKDEEEVDDDRNQNTLLITTEESGIAWDDVMRCLGCSFPSMKHRLEILYWTKMFGGGDNHNNNNTSSSVLSSMRQQQQQQHDPTIGGNNNTRHDDDLTRSRKDTAGTTQSLASSTNVSIPTGSIAGKNNNNSTSHTRRTDPFIPDDVDDMGGGGIATTTTTTTTTTADGGGGGTTTTNNVFFHPEYRTKRLLLGPVDFFRLFVPTVSETALPLADSNRLRVEQMLRWRKRVARAAVLVNSYTKAKCITNKGWDVVVVMNNNHHHTNHGPVITGTTGSSSSVQPPPQSGYIKKRLAYDSNVDNTIKDKFSTDVYYEATVSRDICCQVRGYKNHVIQEQAQQEQQQQAGGDPDLRILDGGGGGGGPSFFTTSSSNHSNNVIHTQPPAFSLYQGFSLVGVHTFYYCPSFVQEDCGIGIGSTNTTLHNHQLDPVRCIPSLRNIIQNNPELDFFVHATYLTPCQCVLIHLFVRSLPKGVDPQFDKVVHRFFQGDAELRKRKLELILQIGLDKGGVSFTSRFLFWLLTLLLRFTLSSCGGLTQQQQQRKNYINNDDRTTLPPINLTLLGDNYHFGGALQSPSSDLPTNYVSSTLLMESRRQNCYLARVILSYISAGYLSKNVADISYNIAGEKEDEVPERILATVRHVRFSYQKSIAFDTTLNVVPTGNERITSLTMNTTTTTELYQGKSRSPNGESLPYLLLKIFVTDPVVATGSAILNILRHQSSSSGKSEKDPYDPNFLRTGTTDRNNNDWVSSPFSGASSSFTEIVDHRKSKKMNSKIVSSTTKKAKFLDSDDPFDHAVNEIIEMLDGIRIPIRKDQLDTSELHKLKSVGKQHPLLLHKTVHGFEQQHNGNHNNKASTNANDTLSSSASSGEIVQMSVLRRVNRSDIRRYFIGSDCQLKEAAFRIVNSTTWMGLTYPIDIRQCRIELQNGQFFQQGYDYSGNPVFYFRTTLLGPWRKNNEAVIAAVLHRFEKSIRTFEKLNPKVKCTIVIVMGKPSTSQHHNFHHQETTNTEMNVETTTPGHAPFDSASSIQSSIPTTTVACDSTIPSIDDGGSTIVTNGDDTRLEEETHHTTTSTNPTVTISTTPPPPPPPRSSPTSYGSSTYRGTMNNPRIPIDEQWYTHANKVVLETLIHVFLHHYPERLYRMFIVLGHGNKSFVRTPMGGLFALSTLYVPNATFASTTTATSSSSTTTTTIISKRTREKIKFLTRYRDLREYIPLPQLSTIVGGTLPMESKHFECE